MCRAAGGAGLAGAERALRSARLLARRRVPRHCPIAEEVRPYSLHAALGAALGAMAWRLAPHHYLAHALLPPHYTAALLLSTEDIYMVRADGGAWHVDWAVKLNDLIDAPSIQGDKLVLNIKQDEQVSYFSTDEKFVEVADAALLRWLRDRVQCALILALEDKRCAQE